MSKEFENNFRMFPMYTKLKVKLISKRAREKGKETFYLSSEDCNCVSFLCKIVALPQYVAFHECYLYTKSEIFLIAYVFRSGFISFKLVYNVPHNFV